MWNPELSFRNLFRFIVKSPATSICEAATEVFGLGDPFEVESVAKLPS